MNYFSGNITFDGNKTIGELPFDYVESLSKNGDKVLFVFGETELSSVKDLLKFFDDKYSDIKSYDLSISSEEKLEIIGESYQEGLYEVVSFEGEQVEFSEILDRFRDVLEVVSVREAELSSKFGNKIVRVDFVY